MYEQFVALIFFMLQFNRQVFFIDICNSNKSGYRMQAIAHHSFFHEATIDVRLRSRLFTLVSQVMSNHTIRKHNCTGKLAHARDSPGVRFMAPPPGHPTHNSPVNMLPWADEVSQFIHRWYCRLFLKRGPTQTECTTNLDDFFNNPLRIARLQHLLECQEMRLWDEIKVRV